MSQPTHHPDPELLLAFATGALDPALSLVVETHAAFCSQCRKELETYDAIGGALLEAIEPVDLSQDLRARVMAEIDGLMPELAGAADESQSISIDLANDPDIARLPASLRGLAQAALAEDGWKKTAKGLHILDLAGDTEDGDIPDVHLFKLDPKMSAPRHTHRGMECTLVLTGAFRDEVGRYGPGDMSIGSPALTHQPVAEEGDACIALSVTTAPVQLTGMMGVIQRALGK